ncbi:hypothetical protein [Litchfieldia alkalitelluris]|uniref:hypothetical protein n=1 Tax=Litchfieldia alkalitelluris TaxID=304268 RepID=UPI0009970373|nr:hypothetical protein [Litchfieldia alkalitelluris]
MSREMKAILCYLAYDLRFSLKVFWSILFTTVLAIFFIALSFDDTVINYSTGAAIYIFCAISGFLLTKETFPYCVKLGTTRSTYVIGALLFNVLLAFFMSFIHVLTLILFRGLIKLTNTENVSIFLTIENATFLSTMSEQLLMDTVICFLLISIGFLLSSIFYRLGLVGGFTGVTIIGLIIILPWAREWVIETLFNIATHSFSLNYLSFLLLGLIAIIPTWLLLRNASTTPGVTR